MIWSCQRESGGDSGDLAAALEAELESAAPGRPGTAREIALALEAFFREHHRNEVMPGEYLLLLMARALWAVGEEAAARRFINARGAEWRVAPAFVEAALARDLSVSHWRALLGSRAVRASDTLARGAIWIVDVLPLLDLPTPAGAGYAKAGAGRSGLELTALRVVNSVIDRLAGVWDHSRGQGILGLRHLDVAAAAMIGCSRRCRKSSAMAREIQAHCAMRLQSAGKSRGWIAVPEVISLDIACSH